MQSFFFIRQDGKYVKVDFNSIYYIEARKNYTRLVLSDRSVMVLVTLKQWEKMLPAASFCRVHRGYIVSLEHILSFDSRFAYLPSANIPIGEQYRNALPAAVTIVISEIPDKLDKLLLADLEFAD